MSNNSEIEEVNKDSPIEVPIEDLEHLVKQKKSLWELIENNKNFKEVFIKGYLKEYYESIQIELKEAREIKDTMLIDIFEKDLLVIQGFHIYMDKVLSLGKFAEDAITNDKEKCNA